jgi:signal transduction histidine kinase
VGEPEVSRCRECLPAVALGVAVVSGAASFAAVGLWWWGLRRGVGAYQSLLSDSVVGVLFPLTGAALVRRVPRSLAGWILVSGGLIGIGALSHQLVRYAVGTGSVTWAIPGAAWLSGWTFAPYWLLITLLPLLFPHGQPVSPRGRRLVGALLVVLCLGTLAAAFRPDPNLESLGVANPLGVGGPSLDRWFDSVLAVAAFGSLFLGAPFAVAFLLARMRRAGGVVRAQLQWLLLGFICTVLLVLPEAVGLGPVWTRDPLYAVGYASIPVCIAVAVVRYRLLDIEVVVNRTIVYGGLTVLGVGAYFAVVALASRLGGALAPIVAAVVALLAAAVRQRAQRLVDRRLFGARNDPYAVVARVRAAAEAVPSPDEVIMAMAMALREALALPYAAVAPAGGPVIEAGHQVAEVAETPIVVRGQLLGVLRVGHRHRGERFAAEEDAALAEVAGRIGMVLQNASLVQDLQRSRERAVAGREDERRRLRRDLHDGIGPALAGLALQAEALGSGLDAQPDLAARAERIRLRLAETGIEVHRIVDGLRPAAIDELGLTDALRTLTAVDGLAGRIDVEIAQDLTRLPAIVEVSAYRIASEALANAIRHSSARRYRLSAIIVGGVLQVEVADDGRGFGADTASGVGLVSMYDRASEAGGTLTVQSSPGHGTVVRARLPLES